MNTDRLLLNRSPMRVDCSPTQDWHGRSVLVVVAKLTWAVSPDGVAQIAVPQSPVRPHDVPSSDAVNASIRYPGDRADEKPGTDVLMVGTAHPPYQRVVTELDVSLRVESRHGALQKTVRVHGPRVWYSGVRGVAPGPPGRLRPTPLVYELAWGGADPSDPARLVERRNPIGTGVAADRSKLVGQPAPQLEDPSAPLTSRTPAPAGFGPIASSWAQRADRAGTYDDAWRRERAPLPPVDFDPRFHCVAPPDLWSEVPLSGDEPVEVLNATPEGSWRFRLPRYSARFIATVRGQAAECPTHLDTFLIDADAGQAELTWRTAVALPRKTEQLESVEIYGKGELPAPVLKDLARRVRQRRAMEAT